jgi:hypothetical protein
MVNDDELGRIWKEAVVAYLRYYLGICVEENHEKPGRIVGVSDKNQSQHLPNTSLERYF